MTARDKRAQIKALKEIVATLRDDLRFSREYAPERIPHVETNLALAKTRLASAQQ